VRREGLRLGLEGECRRSGFVAEGKIDEGLLFEGVGLGGARGGTRGGGALYAKDSTVAGDAAKQGENVR